MSSLANTDFTFPKVRTWWLIPVFLFGLSFGVFIFPDTHVALQEVASDLFVLLSLYLFCRIYGIKVGRVVGRARGFISLLRPSLLVVPPLLMLSLGLIFTLPWLLSYVAPAFVETWILSEFNADEATSPVSGVVTFILIVTLVPIYEEFLFRGLLLHRWSQKWGLRRGMVFSSLAFGVLHFDLIGAFVFGYVMCILYLKTQTLLVPIVAHVINNAVAGTPELIDAVSGMSVSGDALTLADLRSGWFFGVACLFLATFWLTIYLKKNRVSDTSTLPYSANSPKSEVL